MNRGLAALAGVVLVALFILAQAVFTVHQRSQALVLRFGNPVRVITEPGLNFKIPFAETVVMFDRRVLSLDTPAEEIITADQKRVVVDAFSRYRIVDPLLFFQAVGNISVARSRLTNFINSNLRQVLGSEEFATILSGERSRLMQKIRDEVTANSKEFGVRIVDVRIKRADLPRENSQAIFRRMQTERLREAKEARARGFEEASRIKARAERERTILLAEQRKKADILRGEGDGARARIFNKVAEPDPEFYAFYRSLQAYRTALKSGDTSLVVDPNSEFLTFFNKLGAVMQREKRR